MKSTFRDQDVCCNYWQPVGWCAWVRRSSANVCAVHAHQCTSMVRDRVPFVYRFCVFLASAAHLLPIRRQTGGGGDCDGQDRDLTTWKGLATLSSRYLVILDFERLPIWSCANCCRRCCREIFNNLFRTTVSQSGMYAPPTMCVRGIFGLVCAVDGHTVVC